MTEKICHVERIVQRLFERSPGFVIAMFKELIMDDYTRRDAGLVGSEEYLRFKRLLERMKIRGIRTYGHWTWGGWDNGFKSMPVLDLNDIYDAVTTVLARAYLEEHE